MDFGAANRQISAPKGLLVTHFFNHATHHRGQAHACNGVHHEVLVQLRPPKRFRLLVLRADAYQAAGFTDSARAVLQGAPAEFANNPNVKSRLDKLK